MLEVYRQCEDFLALGPQPVATMTMVQQDIAHAQQEGGVFCGVYTAGGKMIGVVDYLPYHFAGEVQAAFISLLMIAAPFRGRGIGSAIVARVEAEIRRDERVGAILLAVQVNNAPALRFWQKRGYGVVSEPQLQADQTVTVLLRKDFVGSPYAV